MAICNLFKKITKSTGSFLMFSQYTEDLTKSSTAPGFYRIIPSKFIAINANYDKPILKKYAYANNDLNIGLPLFLQNDFENGCALLRGLLDEADDDSVFKNINMDTNHWSSNIFWNAVFGVDNKLFSINDIKYVGDINIQSYNEYDGMGYSEIYCFIPNEAKSYTYKVNQSEYPDSFIEYDRDNEYVLGYDEKLPDTANWTNLIKDSDNNTPDYNYARKLIFDFEDNTTIEDKPLPVDSFDFNTIIILYDVKIKDSRGNLSTYKTNIPMGMYITGLIKEDGTVENTHTKYITNLDIYDQGTSYGLRICSRFTVTPEADAIRTVNVKTELTGYSAFCLVMAAFADSQSKMNYIIDSLLNQHQNYNDLYSIFKNSRTNVPYIKEIGGVLYWFVNGRCIGKAGVSGGGGPVASLTIDDINELCPHSECGPVEEEPYISDEELNEICLPSPCHTTDKNGDPICNQCGY